MSDRQLRWQIFFADFNLEFKYVKGEANIVADHLSRPPMVANISEATTKDINRRLADAARKDEANTPDLNLEWVKNCPFKDDKIYVGNDPELKQALLFEAH